MTKPSQIHIQLPNLVALHIAWQSFAASTHEFHPTGGRG